MLIFNRDRVFVFMTSLAPRPFLRIILHICMGAQQHARGINQKQFQPFTIKNKTQSNIILI